MTQNAILCGLRFQLRNPFLAVEQHRAMLNPLEDYETDRLWGSHTRLMPILGRACWI